MQLGISEIFKKVSEVKTEQEKIAVLRQNQCPALFTVLQGAFSDSIQWLLPEGDPPYKPNELVDLHNVFHTEAKKMYLFIRGGHPSLNQTKRETLFIEMLERLNPDDAKIILKIKDKQSPSPDITKALVQQAFPGLVN